MLRSAPVVDYPTQNIQSAMSRTPSVGQRGGVDLKRPRNGTPARDTVPQRGLLHDGSIHVLHERTAHWEKSPPVSDDLWTASHRIET